MASSSSKDGDRAPDRLGLKVALDSSIIDLLCCECKHPIVNARQIIGCGCRICQDCYLQLKQDNVTIVYCRKCHGRFDINKTFRDKAIDNELRRKFFPCFYPDCSWEGSAFGYKDHIANCTFAKIECGNAGCSVVLLQSSQKEHDGQCQFKPIVCSWCTKEIQRGKKQHHELNECLDFNLLCPSGCGKTMPRRKIREHVDFQCQKQTRPCSFTRYGCTAKGKIDQLQLHAKENLPAHLELLAMSVADKQSLPTGPNRIQTGIEESDRKVSSLESEMRTIREDMSQKINTLSEGTAKVDGMLQEIQESFQELALLVQTLQATSYNGQYVWKIPEVKRRREEAIRGKTLSLYSAPFFTSRFGYKMCLRLYVDGDGSGKGTHISFFLTIMRGEYDALLPWPFSQLVTLMLLDQDKKKDIMQCFKPEASSSSFWRPQSEMNVASGCPKFAPISVLSDSKYVQEDTIFFKVVIDTTGLHQP